MAYVVPFILFWIYKPGTNERFGFNVICVGSVEMTIIISRVFDYNILNQNY